MGEPSETTPLQIKLTRKRERKTISAWLSPLNWIATDRRRRKSCYWTLTMCQWQWWLVFYFGDRMKEGDCWQINDDAFWQVTAKVPLLTKGNIQLTHDICLHAIWFLNTILTQHRSVVMGVKVEMLMIWLNRSRFFFHLLAQSAGQIMIQDEVNLNDKWDLNSTWTDT